MARLAMETNTARRDSQVEQSQQANTQAEQAQSLQQAVQIDLNTILGLQASGKELNVLQQLNQDLAQRNESIENSVIFDPTKQLQQIQSICKFLNLSTTADPGSSTQSALLELIYEASKKKKEERFFLLPSQRVELQNLLMREASTEADRQLLNKLSQCVPGLSADSCAKLLSEIGKIVEGTQASVSLSDRTSEKAKEMILEQVTKVITEAGLDLDDQETAQAVKNLQDLLVNNLSNDNSEISVQSAVENIVSRINPERSIDPNDWDQLSRHIIHSLSDDFKEHYSERQQLADLLTDTYQSALVDVNKATQSFDVEKAKEVLSLSLVSNTEDRDKIIQALQAMYNAEHGIEQDLNLTILSGTTQTLKVDTVAQLHDLVERTAVAQVGLEVSKERAGLDYVSTHVGDDITYDNSELIESQQLVVHDMVLEQVNDVKSIEVENIIAELEVKQRQEYLESVRRLAQNLALQEYLENNKREDKQKVVVEFAQDYLQKHALMDVLTRAERESFFAETMAEFNRRYAGSTAIVFEDLRKQIAEQVQQDLATTAGTMQLEQVQNSVNKIVKENGIESQEASKVITQTYQLELERAQEQNELPNFELAQKVIDQLVLEKVQTSTLLPETQEELSRAFQALVNEKEIQVLSDQLREYANAKINEQLQTNKVTTDLLVLSKQANQEAEQAVIEMISRLNEAQVQQLQRNLEAQAKTNALELLKNSVSAERLPVLTALLEENRSKSEAQLLILALASDKTNSEQAKQALAYRTGVDNIETWLECQHGKDLDNLVAELDTEVSNSKDKSLSALLQSAVDRKVISEATLMRLDLVANKDQIVEQFVNNQNEINKQLLLEVAQGKYGDFATISEQVKKQSGSDLSEIARQMAERQQITAQEYAILKAEMESDYSKVVALKLEQDSTSKNEYTGLLVQLAKSKEADRARVLNELSVITGKEQTFEMVLEKASDEKRIDPIIVDYAIGLKNKDANYINAVALYELANKPDVNYNSLRTSLELIKNQAGVDIDQVVSNFEAVAKERTFVMMLDKLAEEKKITALEAQALKEIAKSQESQNLRFIEAQLLIERIQQQARDGVNTRASTAELLEKIENLSAQEKEQLRGYINGIKNSEQITDKDIIVKALNAKNSFDLKVLRSLHCLGLYDRSQSGSFDIVEFNKIVGQLDLNSNTESLKSLIESIKNHVQAQNTELAKNTNLDSALKISINVEQELLNNHAHSDTPEAYISGLVYGRHVAENPLLEPRLNILREQLKGQVIQDRVLCEFVLQDLASVTAEAGFIKGVTLAQGDSSFSSDLHEQNIEKEQILSKELQFLLDSSKSIIGDNQQIKANQTGLYNQRMAEGIGEGFKIRAQDAGTSHAFIDAETYDRSYNSFSGRSKVLTNEEKQARKELVRNDFWKDVGAVLEEAKSKLGVEVTSQLKAQCDEMIKEGKVYNEGLIRYERARDNAKTLFNNFSDREASIDLMKANTADSQLISSVYGQLIHSGELDPWKDKYRRNTAHDAYYEAHKSGDQANLHYRRWSSTLSESNESQYFEEASQIHLGICNQDINQVVAVLEKKQNESEEAWRHRISAITTTFDMEFASNQRICEQHYDGRSSLNDIMLNAFRDDDRRAFSLFIANKSANSVAVESRRLEFNLETLSPSALKASEQYLSLSPEAKRHFDAVTGGFESALERTDISVYREERKLISAVASNDQLDIAVESLKLAIDSTDEKVQTAGIKQILESRQTLSKQTFTLFLNSLDVSDQERTQVQEILNSIPGDDLTADQMRVMAKLVDQENWANALKKIGITPVSGYEVVQRFQELYQIDVREYYDRRHTHESHNYGVISKGSDQFGYKLLGELTDTGRLSDATRLKYYITQADKYSIESFAYSLANDPTRLEELEKTYKEKYGVSYLSSINAKFSNDKASDIVAAFEGMPDTAEKKFARFDKLFQAEESYFLFQNGLDAFLSTDETMEELHAQALSISKELETAKANKDTNEINRLENELDLVCEKGLNSIEAYRMSRNFATDVACQVTTTVAVVGTSIVITVASGGAGAPIAVIIIASATASLGAEVGTRVLLAGEITEEQLQRALICAGVDGLTAGTTGLMFKGAQLTIGKLGGEVGQELLEAAGKKGFTGLAARTVAGSLEGGLQGAQAGFATNLIFGGDLQSALNAAVYEGTIGAAIGGIISDPSHRLANRFKGKGGGGEGGVEYISDPKTPNGTDSLPNRPTNGDPNVIKFPVRDAVNPNADAPSIAAKDNGVLGVKEGVGLDIEIKPESELITGNRIAQNNRVSAELSADTSANQVRQPGSDGAEAIPNRPGLYKQLQVDVNERAVTNVEAPSVEAKNNGDLAGKTKSVAGAKTPANDFVTTSVVSDSGNRIAQNNRVTAELSADISANQVRQPGSDGAEAIPNRPGLYDQLQVDVKEGVPSQSFLDELGLKATNRNSVEMNRLQEQLATVKSRLEQVRASGQTEQVEFFSDRVAEISEQIQDLRLRSTRTNRVDTINENISDSGNNTADDLVSENLVSKTTKPEEPNIDESSSGGSSDKDPNDSWKNGEAHGWTPDSDVSDAKRYTDDGEGGTALQTETKTVEKVDTDTGIDLPDAPTQKELDDLASENPSNKTAEADEPNIDESSGGDSSGTKDPSESWKDGKAPEWTPESDVPDAERFTDDGDGGTALKTQTKTVEKVDADTGSDLPDAPTQQELDDLCDKLFSSPEPAKTSQPEVDSPQTNKSTDAPAKPEPATSAPAAEPARKLQPETETASPTRKAGVVTEEPEVELDIRQKQGVQSTPINELELGLDTRLRHSLDYELGLHPTLRPHPHPEPQPEPLKSGNPKKTQTEEGTPPRRRYDLGSGVADLPEHEMKRRLEEELIELVEVEGDEPGSRRRIRARRHKVINHTDKVVSESEARFSGLDKDQEFEVEKGS